MGLFQKLFHRNQKDATAEQPIPTEVKTSVVAQTLQTTNEILIPCGSCDGHYKIREGEYGIFAGCSHYPACKSTLSLPEFVLKYVQRYGLKIYCWNKQCYKCGKMTPVFSYYLDYDLADLDEFFSMSGPTVGLGDLCYVDEWLSRQIPTIQMRYSKTTHSKYMANTCEHCGALQGRDYVVDDPHEIIGELWHDRGMGKFLYSHLDLKDVSPITEDIKRIYMQGV